jgi:F-type H+-transporting ATPase subunit b
MLIDWFTVGAQALNFLILVWLLERFLYKPILNAIDVREKRIAAELADADAKKAEAQKDRDDLQKKNSAFDGQRDDLLSKAVDEAKAKKEELLAQAQKDSDNVRNQQAAAIKSEQLKLSHDITRLASDEVFGIARKALSDLTTVSLEERLAEVFTRRLRALSGKTKETLAVALETSSEPAVLTSSFNLPDNQKGAIQNALNETFSAEIRVRFQTVSQDVCGIALMANGQEVGWSIDQYLTALNQKVGELLDAQEKPVDNQAKKPEPESTPTLESAALVAAK